MGIGDKVTYLKNGIKKQSIITGWSNHATFIEVFLDNGDVIVDDEIIEIN